MKKFARSGWQVITCKNCKKEYEYAGESALCNCGWIQAHDLCPSCSKKSWSEHEEEHKSVNLVE